MLKVNLHWKVIAGLVVFSLVTVYYMKKDLSRELRHSMEPMIEYIAENLEVRYKTGPNFGPSKYQHKVTIINTGVEDIPHEGWSIYFNSIHLIEFDELKENRKYSLPYCDFEITHFDGGFFKLTPTNQFQGIPAGGATVIKFQSYQTAARSYIFPRWYVSDGQHLPKIIRCTDDEEVKFVSKFDKMEKWKRDDKDLADPFTPEERFTRERIEDLVVAPLKVIPTPVHFDMSLKELMVVDNGLWCVCSTNNPTDIQEEAKKIAELFGLRYLPGTEPCPPSNVMMIVADKVEGVPESNESYKIRIDNARSMIIITAPSSAGIYYAGRTLLSLAERNGSIQLSFPTGTIKDSPRYGYRGLHIDVARNFVPADDVIKIIEAIALYKMNKLHFHLTDDEGWRIEINGLPELTQIGAQRCHTETEEDCLFPALGSGPNKSTSGTGFYSAEEYKRILRAAVHHHVKVIPEIDTPGHSHAAIQAMEARYRKYRYDDKASAEEFRLADPNDVSTAMSVQHFRNNALNPCMASSYRFVEKVITEIKKLHSDIQPLQTIHMGGDEVAKKSWEGSPICNNFIATSADFPHSTVDLQEYYIRKVSDICKQHHLKLAVWEDGAMRSPEMVPYQKSSLSSEVMTCSWNNAGWLPHLADSAHKLANAGYKVVLSQATHFYLDHPQEPDPEEVGLFWATRYIDDRKVFEFTPENLYSNAKFNLNSRPLSPTEVKNMEDTWRPLKAPENIVGMQAAIWSEMLRDVTMFHYQLFPRLIAFAERAWHKASWETSKNKQWSKHEDWRDFVNGVGYKELIRLKNRNIKYRIPPPGVRYTDDDKIEICSKFPGLTFLFRQVTDDDSSNWSDCIDGQPIPDKTATYEFVTYDGERRSRPIRL